MVIIVDANKVTQLQMPSGGGSLRGNTLHETSISEEHEGVVVDQLISRLVIDGSSVGLGNGKTDGIGETLSKGTSGDLNTRSIGLSSIV